MTTRRAKFNKIKYLVLTVRYRVFILWSTGVILEVFSCFYPRLSRRFLHVFQIWSVSRWFFMSLVVSVNYVSIYILSVRRRSPPHFSELINESKSNFSISSHWSFIYSLLLYYLQGPDCLKNCRSTYHIPNFIYGSVINPWWPPRTPSLWCLLALTKAPPVFIGLSLKVNFSSLTHS